MTLTLSSFIFPQIAQQDGNFYVWETLRNSELPLIQKLFADPLPNNHINVF